MMHTQCFWTALTQKGSEAHSLISHLVFFAKPVAVAMAYWDGYRRALRLQPPPRWCAASFEPNSPSHFCSIILRQQLECWRAPCSLCFCKQGGKVSLQSQNHLNEDVAPLSSHRLLSQSLEFVSVQHNVKTHPNVLTLKRHRYSFDRGVGWLGAVWFTALVMLIFKIPKLCSKTFLLLLKLEN